VTDDFTNEPYNGEPAGPSKGLLIGLGLLAVLFIGALAAAVYFLLQPGAPTETIRDIVIILVAFEFMIIGLALVILLLGSYHGAARIRKRLLVDPHAYRGKAMRLLNEVPTVLMMAIVVLVIVKPWLR